MRLNWELAESMQCWGDGRVLMFNGPPQQVQCLAEQTGARFVDSPQLLGEVARRRPASPRTP